MSVVLGNFLHFACHNAFCGEAAPRAKFSRGSESGREAERALCERRSETGLCERKSRRRHIRKHSAGICGVLQMMPGDAMKPRKVSSLTPFAPVLYGDPGAFFSVRGRGSVLHRTRPKCETRKKGARCAPDFAAKPPREQSSRRNAQSSSGGAKRDFASGRAAAGVDANTLHFPCRVLRNSPCGCDGGGAGS